MQLILLFLIPGASQNSAEAERLLDAPDVVLSPISLSDLFLANGDSAPANSHHRDIVNIILIEIDLQTRIMSFWPLIQSPALNDLCGLNKLEIFASDVASEQLKFAPLFGAFEDLGRSSGESSNTLWIGEGLVKLGSWGSELFSISYGCSIHRGAAACACMGRAGWLQGS